MLRLSILVCLVALFASAGLFEKTTPPSHLIVVDGPLLPGQSRELTLATQFYGDYGTFALAEVTPSALSTLIARGYTVHDIGLWPNDADLLVTNKRQALRPTDSILYDNGIQLLATSPRGSFQEDRHGGCAHELALVPRTPWTIPRALSLPGDILTAISADDRIVPLVNQVNQSNIAATVSHLSSYFSRRANQSEIHLAKDWLINALNSYGNLNVSTFSFSSSYAPNVVAELTGTTHPEKVIVLGAHYDSINGGGSNLSAPGADDNASGSAALLETARILSQSSFENTIRFVWFSAEELGLIGAAAYADFLVSEGVEPIAMFNMDMVAYREAGDAFNLDFATNNTDPVLVQFCRDVTAAYIPTLPTITGVLTAGTSDHQAFQSEGIPSVFFFEDLADLSPHLHTSADTVGNSANDFALARDITKSFLASAATLAQPIDLALTHNPLTDTNDSGGPYPLSLGVTSLTPSPVAEVEVYWRVDGSSWQQKNLLLGNGTETWVGSLPGLSPHGVVDYYFLARDGNGHEEWLPDGLEAGNAFYTFLVGNISLAFADDFETSGDNGWTHAQVSTQDDWQHGSPAGLSGDPSSAYSGSQIWGNDLGPSGWNGEYQPNVENWLLSPSINCSGLSDVHLRFQRWLTVEDGIYDQATIEIGNQTVWTNPASSGGSNNLLDSSWTLQDIDISALADGNPNLRIRFRLQSDGGVQFGGWNLDDISVASLLPGTTPPLVASDIHISAAQGSNITLDLSGGNEMAGRTYLVAMSVSGSVPGTPVGGIHFPLNFDAVTDLGFGLLGTPLLPGWYGTFNGSGNATASLIIPPLTVPGLAGLSLTMAWLTLGPIDMTSNSVSVNFVP